MLKERKLNRLPNFNYSSGNLYFVTSCVKSRDHWFGEIVNGNMHLNEYGKIADKQFNWLQHQYPYIKIHAHIVMPNHMHAIIEIIPPSVGTGRDLSESIPDQEPSPYPFIQSLQTIKIKSVSELVGAYKTTTTKQIRNAGLSEFEWQRSFHDHIIRDARGYQNIFKYIQNNPTSWPQDKFFTP